MEKIDIAKTAYKQIVQTILDLEENHHILCDLPRFIEIEGERFHRNQLHHFLVKDDEVQIEFN